MMHFFAHSKNTVRLFAFCQDPYVIIMKKYTYNLRQVAVSDMFAELWEKHCIFIAAGIANGMKDLKQKGVVCNTGNGRFTTT